MTERSEPISMGQYVWTVGASVVAGGLYIWPQPLLQQAGTQGIYTLLIMIGLATIIYGAQAAIALTPGAPTFLALLRDVAPGWGPLILWPVKVGLSLILDALLLSFGTGMMQTMFYSATPLWVLMLAYLVAIGVVAVRRMSTVTRFVQLILSFDYASFAILLVMVTPHFRFLSATVLPGHLYLAPWATGLLGNWFFYSNVDVVYNLVGHVHWRSVRRAVVSTVAVVWGQGLTMLALYLWGVWTLGPDALSHVYWPLGYVFSVVSTPAFLIKSAGLVFVIICSVKTVVYLSANTFSLTWSLVGPSAPASSAKRSIIVGGLLAMVLGIAIAIPSLATARRVLTHWVSPAVFLVDVTTLPTVYILSRLRTRARTKLNGFSSP